jgi:hypothetical protein
MACRPRPRREAHRKGVIERDIEKQIPAKNDEIILYCGGNVTAMAGGIREWRAQGLPEEKS